MGKGHMRRSVFTIVLATFLTVMLFCPIELRFVKADGTIYIAADGSIEGTTYIQTSDNATYVFTANIIDSIIIEKNNMVLDGNGYTLEGVGAGTGIDLSETTNVTVQNMQVEAFSLGIFLDSSSNDNIFNNNITDNFDGVVLESSSGNVLVGNNVANSDSHGITLVFSSDNTVTGNNLTDNFIGIAVYSSSNDTILENSVAYGGYDGIYLYNSDYNTISANELTFNNECGIKLESDSNFNNISGNNVTSNTNGMGIFLYQSSTNTLFGNTMTTASAQGYDYGIDGSAPSDFVNYVDTTNTVEGKPVYYWIGKQDSTVPLDAGTVVLVNCTNITVQNLNLTSNRQGILLAYTTECEITQNNITDNCIGLLTYNSSDNVIYQNNFFYNGKQAYCDSGSMNCWDSGYPSGGNYWSDYLGTDLRTGRYQNETGSDGIGDIAYPINVNGIDNYPLMKPWPTTDIAITNVTPAKTVTAAGYTINVNVTIRNLGDYDETFNVTLYVAKTIVDRKQIVLASRNSVTVTLAWNTTGFGLGNYTISAYADLVPSENGMSNNGYSDKTVFISIPGDITGGTPNLWDFVPDGVVDGKDISTVARSFGTVPGDLWWNANCDINNDGSVDGRDLSTVARHMGS
jgi:parallel beta-helix repeat protein